MRSILCDPRSAVLQDLSDAPPFTLADLRNAIPAHCWERSPARSMAYLFKDVAIVAGLAAGAFALNSWCAAKLLPCCETCHTGILVMQERVFFLMACE